MGILCRFLLFVTFTFSLVVNEQLMTFLLASKRNALRLAHWPVIKSGVK